MGEAEGLKRPISGLAAVAAGMVMSAGQPAVALAPAVPATPVAAVPAESAAPAAPTGYIVKSPMVGTFYRASSPGGKPLVDVGQQVKEGEAVCIIEAMKIMNEIETDRGGTITKVMAENGQAVEFGQPLFVIE